MNPPITIEEKLNGIEIRTKINEMLDRKGVLQFFRVMGIGYSGARNIKVTSTHSCKASDLMEYGCDIARIITKNEVLSILPDSEHYWVKINKILTWCGKDDLMTIQMVHEELRTYIPEYRNTKQWRTLCWLGTDETIHAKNFASTVVDLTNKQDRDILLGIRQAQLFNYNCTISLYEDRPQIFQCSKCGMFLH